MSETRYTLSLPEPIYEEIRTQAEKHNTTIKEVVRQCLKFGLIAMKMDEDPNADIFFREREDRSGEIETIETRVKFLW